MSMNIFVRVLTFGLVAMCGSLVGAADKPQDFSGQDLVGRDFRKQRLEKANFEDAVLKDAKFDEAILIGANFQGADLSNTYFANADLTNADFRGARLAFTSWYRATLNGANLEKADLSQNGGLSYIKLRKANLKNLKAIGPVTAVDFSEADLRGANLVGMQIIGEASRFRKAKYDSKTRWPKGFDIDESGAILVEEKEEEPEDKPKPAPSKDAPGNDSTSKKLEKEFAALDGNEDGRLSGKEMRGLEAYDKNKDGRVTLEEFIAGKRE